MTRENLQTYINNILFICVFSVYCKCSFILSNNESWKIVTSAY